MSLLFEKATVLGATGPTGRHLTRLLLELSSEVRVVCRDPDRLRAAYAGSGADIHPADLSNESAAETALAGSDVAFCCVGAPVRQLDRLVAIAQRLASVLRRRRDIRLVQISNTWSFAPIQALPLSESHPRHGGPRPVVLRREAEDVLRQEGAAVLNLPDFYGPGVVASTLQRALQQALHRRKITCIGSAQTARDYVYVPDAAQVALRLAAREGAYGRHWILAGAGQITMRQVAAIVAHRLSETVWARGAGRLTLAGAALLDPELRAFLPMVPTYLAPVCYDDRCLHGLIGQIPVTRHEVGIGRTLDWLVRQDAGG